MTAAAGTQEGSGMGGCLAILLLIGIVGVGFLGMVGAAIPDVPLNAPAPPLPPAQPNEQQGNGRTIYVPDLGEVSLQNHAEERHGTQAEQARTVIAQSNGWHEWRCGQKVWRIMEHPGQPGWWAVMIIEGGWELTALMTSDDGWAFRQVNRPGCDKTRQLGHP